MGVGLILIGVLYVVYRYFKEDCKANGLQALGIIGQMILVILGFYFLACILDMIQTNFEGLYFAGLCVFCLISIPLIIWLVTSDVKDAIKDAKLPGEVKLFSSEPERQSLLKRYVSYEEFKLAAFRRYWLSNKSVLLSRSEAEFELNKLKESGKEIVTPQMINEERRFLSSRRIDWDNNTHPIDWVETPVPQEIAEAVTETDRNRREFSEFEVAMYDEDLLSAVRTFRKIANQPVVQQSLNDWLATLSDEERTGVEPTNITPEQYLHFRDWVGEDVIAKLVKRYTF